MNQIDRIILRLLRMNTMQRLKRNGLNSIDEYCIALTIAVALKRDGFAEIDNPDVLNFFIVNEIDLRLSSNVWLGIARED